MSINHVDALNGYRRGQRVEARIRINDYSDPGPWRVGYIATIDADDARLTYAVKFGDRVPEDTADYSEWTRPEDIRPVSVAPAGRLEWRYKYAAGDASNWMPVEPGEVGCYSRISGVEFRERAPHTDEEILAKAREVAASVFAEQSEIRRVLRGEF